MGAFDQLLNRALTFLARATGEPLTKVHAVDGFRVELTNSRADIEDAAVLDRFREALRLIARYQPTRYAHLRRDVRFIRIERAAHRGEYRRTDHSVMTELTFLARRDIGAAVVASSILHEGVHARVHRMAPGISGDQIGREERLCRRAELYFGQALPAEQGRPVLERAEASLALSDEEIAPRATAAQQRAAIERVDRESARRTT